MKDAFKIFRKYLPPYKGYLTLTIVFNILGALFGIFSIVALIPLLKILFKIDTQVYVPMEVHFSFFPFQIPREAIMNNLYAWLSEQIIKRGEVTMLVIFGVLASIMSFFKTGFTYMGSFSTTKIRNHVVKDIRNALFKKIIALPIGYFSEEKKGDIIARVTGDVTEVEMSVMNSLDVVFKNPFIILFSVLSMVFMSWQLTLFVFIMLPVAGGVIGAIGKSLRKHSAKGQNKMGEILSTIEESLGGLRIIKAFNAEGKVYEKQSLQNLQYRSIMDRILLRRVLASPMSEFLGTLVFLLVMWYGGSLILSGNSRGTLDAEEFLVYLMLFYTIINPVKGFSTAFYNIQKGLASMDRIDSVLKTTSDIRISKTPVHIKTFTDRVEYKDVWFRYQEEYVLQDISLQIKKGQTIALVGASGSGKSTIADILPRFYDVTKGEVTIDGVNLKDLDIVELRNLLGIVNQEAILFNDTIYNNITFGVNEATQEEVENAARIANAHDFILETESGYQTNIGDRGNRLSGGQKQRISIARAVLTNPPIMILDEATSALDTESERLVQEAINNLMKERTSLVIAHRLSTIRNADLIFVLDNGKIIEQGDYNNLLAKGGEFKKLHDNQFK